MTSGSIFRSGVALLGAAAIASTGGPAIAAAGPGGTRYRAHVFPVAGPHSTRGPIGGFGAPRSGGRTHEGFDIVAPCGAGLRAVSSGRVRRRGFDPVLYGNFVLIHGAGERRSYYYAHLRRPAPVRPGERLFAGERIGAVGRTGNARTVGCHLHFEVWVRGRPINPAPVLSRWGFLRAGQAHSRRLNQMSAMRLPL